jgi:hypothetical protein
MESAKSFLQATTPTVIFEQAAMSDAETKLKGKRLLAFNLSTQDLQINKEGTFSGQRLLRAGSGELEYRLSDLSGKIYAAGVLFNSTAEQEMPWGKEEVYPPTPSSDKLQGTASN